MDYKALGHELIKLVGGKDNISRLTHCATRLRFEFYDKNKVDLKRIENTPGVINVVDKGGQFQVVIGNEVQTTFRVIVDEMGDQAASNGKEEKKEDKGSIVNRIISVISTTFTPVIPALIGGGMMKAVLSILVLLNLVDTTGTTYGIINFISDAPFYFMPVLLAYGAAIKFNCSPILAMTMACALLHPTWSGFVAAGEAISFFGIPVTLVDYSYSVIPIILGVWILSYVEKFAEKYSPSIIKFFIKPLIIMFVSIPIGLLIVGPFGNLLNDMVQAGAAFINGKASWLIPMLMGAFQPFLVLTGTAWAMTPIATVQITNVGFETVNGPGMLASNIAQGAAALAVAVKTKNKQLKQLASSSGFTGVMGITEPCLYGVNLKLKRPFIASMIGGGIGGIYAGLSGLVRYSFVSPGLAAVPAFIGENPMNVVHALITIVISFAAGFAASWILGFDDPEEESPVKDNISSESEKLQDVTVKSEIKGEIVYAPIKGRVIPLEEVPDEVFSNGILGKGAAIVPEEGCVYAPFDGKIASVFDTKHAICLVSDDGMELLIHVGIDTVNLEGKPFTAVKDAGDRIKKGEKLLEFNIEEIKKAGYETVTPVLVGNTDNYKEIVPIREGEINPTEEFIHVIA